MGTKRYVWGGNEDGFLIVHKQLSRLLSMLYLILYYDLIVIVFTAFSRTERKKMALGYYYKKLIKSQ